MKTIRFLAVEAAETETNELLTYAEQSSVPEEKALRLLDFNLRVLAQALDTDVPLLERIRFVHISRSNLDEFFAKHLAKLEAQASPRVAEILAHAEKTIRLQGQIFHTILTTELRNRGIATVEYAALPLRLKNIALRKLARLRPALSCVRTSDGKLPLGFLQSGDIAIAAKLKDSQSGMASLGIIRVPRELPVWILLQGGQDKEAVWVHLGDVLLRTFNMFFPGYRASDTTCLSVTRSFPAENSLKTPRTAIRERVEEDLRRRPFSPVVKIEWFGTEHTQMSDQIKTLFTAKPSLRFRHRFPFLLGSLEPLLRSARPELTYERWHPVSPQLFMGKRGENSFDIISRGDAFVHHPFESFRSSVERFLTDSAEDPRVSSIAMTLYRTGAESRIVSLLCRAAQRGKHVSCLVELRARLDEENNLRTARELSANGVHVVFGRPEFKTHAKIILVERDEEGGLQRYAHVASGNYHAETAELYTDVGLFTADPRVTSEVQQVWEWLSGRIDSIAPTFLLVAPFTMRERFLQCIAVERENAIQGLPAHIIAKMNCLDDQCIAGALQHAAEAGVKVDLIVRGAVVLPEPSHKNIRVLSVVGRLLEHSRIFYFRNNAQTPELGSFFLGSADWMRRNLSDRVEVVIPVERWAIRQRLWEILQLALEDTRQVWLRDVNGTYRRHRPDCRRDSLGSHAALMRLTRAREQETLTLAAGKRVVAAAGVTVMAPKGDTFQCDAAKVVARRIRKEAKNVRRAVKELTAQPGPAEVQMLWLTVSAMRATLRTYGYLFGGVGGDGVGGDQERKVATFSRLLRRLNKELKPLRRLDTTGDWIERQLRRQKALKSEAGSLIRSALRAEREPLAATAGNFFHAHSGTIKKNLRAAETFSFKSAKGTELFPFHEAVSRAVLLHASALDFALRKAVGEKSREHLQHLRKAVARLREVLEPWEEEYPEIRPISARLRVLLEMLRGLRSMELVEARLLQIAGPLGAEFISTLTERLLLGEGKSQAELQEQKTHALEPFIALCNLMREEQCRCESSFTEELERTTKKRILMPLESWIVNIQAQNRVAHAGMSNAGVSSRLVRVK